MRNRTMDIPSSTGGVLSAGVAWALAGLPAVRQNRLWELYVFPSAGWDNRDRCDVADTRFVREIRSHNPYWTATLARKGFGRVSKAAEGTNGIRFFSGPVLRTRQGRRSR